jgi:acyl-coenzyme A thioesterase PaaI-like protein
VTRTAATDDDRPPEAPDSAAIESRAIFELENDLLHPSSLARGPWYHGTQHGSSMLGLLARAVEQHPSEQPVQVVRLTVDFLRAAPLAPVTTPTRVVQRTRSIEIVEACIEADGQSYARATAMRFRVADIDVSSESPRYGLGPRHALPGPGEGPQLLELDDDGIEAFYQALEMRPPRNLEAPAMWLRMRCPFVAREPTSPLVLAAIAADWTYAVPFLHDHLNDPDAANRERAFTTINPDTSLNLHRPIEGEWVCLDSHVHYAGLGAGSAVALLHDERGPVGHASQAILIRGPDKRPILEDEMRQRD